MNAWINADKATPEPLLDVLIVIDRDDEPHVEMGFRRDNGQWFLTGSEPLIEVFPLCWMHLPALPQTRPVAE